MLMIWIHRKLQLQLRLSVAIQIETPLLKVNSTDRANASFRHELFAPGLKETFSQEIARECKNYSKADSCLQYNCPDQLVKLQVFQEDEKDDLGNYICRSNCGLVFGTRPYRNR